MNLKLCTGLIQGFVKISIMVDYNKLKKHILVSRVTT